MFEVEDLLVASPATVSRNGMVYMEPASMGVEPLIKSWLNTVPSNIKEKSKNFMPILEGLFKKVVDPCIEFLRKNLKETIPTMDNMGRNRVRGRKTCIYKEGELKREGSKGKKYSIPKKKKIAHLKRG